MKKYKVLRDDLTSPFKWFQFELNKEYVCEDFDESDEECSRGFYATDLEGLTYSLNNSKGNKVFEVEVGGKQKIFNQFKQRFEKQTILREVSKEELDPILKAEGENLGYDLYHACYPVNPFEIETPKIGDKEIDLLRKWAYVLDSIRDSVRDSARASVLDSADRYVWDSVRNSVWDSIRASVLDSVRASVRDSVCDSTCAYIGSLFTSIENWEYIDHASGEYPFQPCVDLWHMGLVPSFDGTTWRLHGGKDAKVLFEIKKSEM